MLVSSYTAIIRCSQALKRHCFLAGASGAHPDKHSSNYSPRKRPERGSAGNVCSDLACCAMLHVTGCLTGAGSVART
jgi:hypothetical protein